MDSPPDRLPLCSSSSSCPLLLVLPFLGFPLRRKKLPAVVDRRRRKREREMDEVEIRKTTKQGSAVFSWLISAAAAAAPYRARCGCCALFLLFMLFIYLFIILFTLMPIRYREIIFVHIVDTYL